jgi:hypothetical protein
MCLKNFRNLSVDKRMISKSDNSLPYSVKCGKKVKVKVFHYKPDVALGVPGG